MAGLADDMSIGHYAVEDDRTALEAFFTAHHGRLLRLAGLDERRFSRRTSRLATGWDARGPDPRGGKLTGGGSTGPLARG